MVSFKKVKSYSVLLLFAILFITLLPAYSNTIILEDNIAEYPVFSDELEIFEDTEQKVTFEEIIHNPNNSKFSKYKSAECFSKNLYSTYWLRFKIKNNSSNNNKWILEILDSRFDEVIFYSPDLNNESKYNSAITGIAHPFENRQYQHKNFVFDIPLPKDNQEHYYYLKIKPGVVGIFLSKVRQNKIFSSYAFSEYLLLGMYYGVLLIMGFYNLFIYFSLKERVYLYYFFYLMIWAFNSTLDDGLGFQYIWSEYSIISKAGAYVSKILMLGIYVLYSISFLNINIDFTKNQKKFYFITILYLLISIVAVYLNFTLVYNILFIITFAYISFKSYIIYKSGYKPARFFLLGNGIIVIGLIIYMLKVSGIFKSYSDEHPGLHIFMVYIKNIIMVIDIVILSIALGDRMRFLKRTAELAQQEAYNQLKEKKLLSEKVNRELEQKVSERTKEIEEQKQLLEEANDTLKTQAEEINRMNALLDLDNWKLKKNIIEEKEARITLKEFNFKEFQQVYTDDFSVYRYLDELKEEKGYNCRKCGHTKYGKGLSNFSKRCCNCRYDESVTAYTVFHGCKFNIQIAMYIVVIINRYGSDISITDISKEVKMRNGTCWKFAQKLLSIRENKEYKQANENEKIKILILNG